MTFEKLKLIEPILRALKNEGYEKPTEIQREAIPVVLGRKDILGCAQTGTGKTAAFAIPILQILTEEHNGLKNRRDIKCLVLTPTRELAIQIGESFSAYGKYTGVKHTVIFGGVSQHSQVEKLRAGVDVLIATPGRLLDLMNQRFVNISLLNMFVLDEADRMLDMGFIHDIKKIIAKLPVKKQTLFFSATMPDAISKLADSLLSNPVKIAVTPVSSTVESIAQSIYFVSKSDKKSLLIHLLKNESIASALIFTRTKHGANKISAEINRAGIHSDAIHGNKSQSARQNALNLFKNKKIKVLVATDIAARGIDVDELSHVINYELPEVPETYVHRIGRTGRAGLSGTAISFCSDEEKPLLRDIKKLIRIPIDIIEKHPFSMNVLNGADQSITSEKKFLKSVGTSKTPDSDNKRSFYAKKRFHPKKRYQHVTA